MVPPAADHSLMNWAASPPGSPAAPHQAASPRSPHQPPSSPHQPTTPVRLVPRIEDELPAAERAFPLFSSFPERLDAILEVRAPNSAHRGSVNGGSGHGGSFHGGSPHSGMGSASATRELILLA